MNYIISLLVENRSGVLARIANVFSCRSINIQTLYVSETFDPTISTLTVSVDGDDSTMDKVVRHLYRLPDVIEIKDLSKKDFVERGMALVKVKVNSENREKILDTAKIFRGEVLDVGHETIIVEITGNGKKIDAFIDLLKPLNIIELIRTGRFAIGRGK